ncbi:MAG: MerR family transcriptional regulator [Rhodococcus sp. (in: high G+C Gram-positive bacteria)]|jgi:DNA-binding transcriptional MerR regulator|nr:MerR family transcriptional regulator [Rhodococcus sp. (in: high G+C Gram-positive bacteria)]MDI6630663.1 MerR family transcriptional regulator [Rhodococcus sp. (in: high G+C Gram-positive bacteria)]
MNGLLTIGEFSRITHLSVKTLRRYHESGLLEPATVDDYSGYRYYDTDQVATAQVISRFRTMQMPEREVRAIMHTPDPDARARLITEHLTRLERQLDDTRSAVTALRRLLDPTPPTIEVRRVLTEQCSVAAISEMVDASEVLDWYSEAMAEIDAAAYETTGPPGGLYDNELFTEGRGAMTVYVPTAHRLSLNRIRPMTLQPTELAVTVHHGRHDDIDVTYGALGIYVETNGLAIAGPVREVYVVGPRDTEDSSLWRTEIGWPVFAASPTAT